VDSGRRFALGATARFLQSLPQPMFERGVKVCLEQASTGSAWPKIRDGILSEGHGLG
jgi:hypothetical protein